MLIENHYCPIATLVALFLGSALVLSLPVEQFIERELRPHKASSFPRLLKQLPRSEGYVARVFTFVDTTGVELHRINDPEDKLPIPEITQLVSIGTSRMRVESVTLQWTLSSSPSVYSVRVWSVPE